MDPQVAPIPTNIIIIVLAMTLWALAFARLIFGFRTIVDTQNGIKVVVGAPAEAPEQLVTAYLNGTLQAGDNLCDH